MKRIGRALAQGLFLILPAVITLQLIHWALVAVESSLSPALQTIVPEHLYFPGLAIITFLIICILIGFSASWRNFNWAWQLPGRVFMKIPGVSQIHGLVQDIFEVMSGDNFEEESVVMVKLPNSEVELIGIVTKHPGVHGDKISELLDEDRIAVFLPMAYNIGGYMIMVPKSCTTNLDMKPAEALQLVLSGGLGKSKAPDMSTDD